MTAVFSNVSRRVADFEQHGISAAVVAPEDFWILRKVGNRWYTLIYAWFVVGYLLYHRKNVATAIFHSHAGWAFHLLRRWSKRLRQIHTITQFHGLEPLFFEQLEIDGRKLSFRFRLMQGIIAKRLIRASCRRSDQVHCLNSFEITYLIHNRWVDESRVFRYSNGVQLDMFGTRTYDLPARKVLFLGQWIENKGIRALIGGFEEAHRNFPDLELCCLGTLCEAAKVLSMVPGHLHSAIVVVPKFSHKDVKKYLFAAEMFILPSFSEGFSMALVEAMASGLPIITTPVGAAVDLLEDGVSALFIPVNSPEHVARAIEKIAADIVLQKRLGTRAQSQALNYEWSRVCDQYRALILSCGQ